MDCQNVFVFQSIAYIETLDEKGNPVMRRFSVRRYAKEYLLRFDGGEKVAPGGFVFHVPSPCRTLDYKIRDYQKRKAAGKSTNGPRTNGRRLINPKTYGLRNGKGAVHFINAEEITVHRD
jgi:hypothetical protein